MKTPVKIPVIISVSIGLVISLVMFVGFIEIAQGDCKPQCVPWARDHSDVKIHGDAKDWPQLAERYGCKMTSTPKKGRVIVIDERDLGGSGRTHGHVIAVLKSEEKDDDKYSLTITHSNYDDKCGTETVKATYYKDEKKIKFKEGHWSGKKFRVKAIIKKD